MASDDQRWGRAALGFAGAALVGFVAYRARVVGGCDPASYYLESLRVRGIDGGVRPDPTVPAALRGALAPMCTEALASGRIVSFFPPGFPLLLAFFGLLGAPFVATPFLGAASGLALFHLLKRRAGGGVAFALMVAWLCSPLVLYGSTQVMSDLPMTAFLLFCLVAFEEERFITAGVLLGFAVGIRPTALLLAPVLAGLLPAPRRLLRVGLGLVVALAAWAPYVRLAYGGWSLPYLRNAVELSGEIFPTQLAFLLRELALQQLPWVGLALIGLLLAPRRVLPLALWIALFTLFHALWRAPFDLWWCARFVLPALPAVYLAAAEALAVAEKRTASTLRPGGRVLLATSVAAYGVWALFASPARELRAQGEEYRLDAEAVARVLPRDALVAAVNHSAPLRLYGQVASFYYWSPDAPALMQWAHGAGRPLYAVLGDDERRVGPVTPFASTTEATLPSGARLERLFAPRWRVDIGTDAARPLLGDGWSVDESAGSLTFVWAVGTSAWVRVPPEVPPGDTRVWLSAAAFAGTPGEQTLELRAGGVSIGRFVLTADYRVFTTTIPRCAPGLALELTFTHATTPASVGGPPDARALAAAFDWIAFDAAR